MEEQEQIDLGAYCTELFMDERFAKLVNLTETSLSLDMLNAEGPMEREKVHGIYQGLKYFLDTMRQFAANKDQILALRETKED
jgi:hypothetical protein